MEHIKFINAQQAVSVNLYKNNTLSDDRKSHRNMMVIDTNCIHVRLLVLLRKLKYGTQRGGKYLIWFDLIWFDLIWFDLIWFDLINAWILPKLHPTLRFGKVA
jgi:hypothetical protein